MENKHRVIVYNIVITILKDLSFTYGLQGYFTGTGAIVRLPQCQWSNPEMYG